MSQWLVDLTIYFIVKTEEHLASWRVFMCMNPPKESTWDCQIMQNVIRRLFCPKSLFFSVHSRTLQPGRVWQLSGDHCSITEIEEGLVESGIPWEASQLTLCVCVILLDMCWPLRSEKWASLATASRESPKEALGSVCCARSVNSGQPKGILKYTRANPLACEDVTAFSLCSSPQKCARPLMIPSCSLGQLYLHKYYLF